MPLAAISASGGNRIVECPGDHIVCLPAGYHLPLLYPPIRGRHLFKNGMLRNISKNRYENLHFQTLLWLLDSDDCWTEILALMLAAYDSLCLYFVVDVGMPQ